MQASLRTCWADCTCKLLLMIQALVCQFPTRKWWFISGPPGGAKGALCPMFRIHFTVRHCNRYNHTVPHVMIPGHWSFAKCILSVIFFVFSFLSFLYLIHLFYSVLHLCYLSHLSFCLLISHVFSFIFSFISSCRFILLSRCATITISLCRVLTCFIHFLFLLPSTYVSFIGPYTFQFHPLLASFCIINFRYIFFYLFTVLYLYHPSKFPFLRFFLLCVFFYFLSISRIFFCIIFISQSLLPP
jgi:hypothetical protein